MPDNSPLATAFDSSTAIGFRDFQEGTTSFWLNYGRELQSFYGSGLYVAAHPVFSETYSGPDSPGRAWGLLQIQLPVGFRFIDLNRHIDEDIPREIQDELNSKGCHFTKLEDIFKHGVGAENEADRLCSSSIKSLFSKTLKIDGLSYRFGSQFFDACAMPPTANPEHLSSLELARLDRPSALIITSAARFQAKDVKLFNARTRNDQATRLHIEAMFEKSLREDPPIHVDVIDRGSSDVQKIVSSILERHPHTDPNITDPGFEQQRHDQDAERHYQLSPFACFDQQNCFMVSPAGSTASRASQISNSRLGMYRLHWKDLTGMTFDDKKEDEYFTQNLFGCGPKPSAISTPVPSNSNPH